MKKPYAIIIMDGYGIAPAGRGNAIYFDGSKNAKIAPLPLLFPTPNFFQIVFFRIITFEPIGRSVSLSRFSFYSNSILLIVIL